MDFLSHLQMGFSVCTEWTNLLLCFIGCLFGTLVGVLPGLGPSASIALLLPMTYKLTPVQAIIMLAGIYYGAQYGGSTSSILVNIPGEASTVITTIDGYQMAKKGRAGPALGMSAFGSFIGGTFAIIMMMLLSPPLSEVALKFGPTEMTTVMVFGLTMVIYLSEGSLVKGLSMGALGLLLGCVGTDLLTGRIRYTLGFGALADGLGVVPVAMGLFGVSEVLLTVEQSSQIAGVFRTKVKELFPTKQDWKDSAGPITRGSILGFFLGLIPGGGPVVASFFSYGIEKRLSKHPERFGTGEIAGVSAPETANNAGAGGAFIPLMTLGIPCTPPMAVLLGAFIIQGITPGPLLIEKHPDLFWGLVGSMYLGNIMLLVLNLPLIGIWVKILKIPYIILSPLILLFCLIGAYTINNSISEIVIMVLFGIFGYLLKKFNYPLAPFILAFILGPMLEKYLGQAVMMSNEGPLVFFSRPISGAFLIGTFFLLISPWILKLFRRKRFEGFDTK